MKFLKLSTLCLFLAAGLMFFTGAMHPGQAESATASTVTAIDADVNEAESRAQRRAYRKALRENTTFSQRVALKVVQKKLDKQMDAEEPMGTKSQLVALILAIFLGGLGSLRFYLGYTGFGVIQLLTGGGCGIWALIDIIRIAMGDLGPRDGEYDETF